MASVSSSDATVVPDWSSESNSNSFRDVSFSSYLNSSEEKYIHGLIKSSQNLKHQHHDPTKNKDKQDEEIDVFNADKYFKGRPENELDAVRIARNQHVHNQDRKQHVKKVSNQSKTPSNYSEPSSLNSQTALLRRMQRVSSMSSTTTNANTSKSQGKKVFFPWCSSCSNKSSVDIEDEFIREQGKRDVTVPSIKTNLDTAEITRMNKLRLDRQTTNPFFYSPSRILNDGGVKQIQSETKQLEIKKRESLEVLSRSSDIDDKVVVERGLSMLSWDAIPRSVTEEIKHSSECASGPPSEVSYKDTDSEGSSDLFEIECLRNPCDRFGYGCGTPNTCYAPSEASIEWSVVTASAADFSTVSDSEDHISSSRTSGTQPKVYPKMTKKTGMLLGCKSQKAVRVAGEALQIPIGREKNGRQRHSDSFIPTTRFQAEAKKIGFGQKERKEVGVITSKPYKWSHSSHASEFKHIQ